MTYYAVAMTVTLILCYYNTTVYSLPGGAEARCFRNWKTAFLVLLPLTLLAVFRWDVGVDTVYGYNYWDSFQKAKEWDNYREFEPGFFLLTALLSQTGVSYWGYLAIIALLYMLAMSYAIAKGSIWTKWSVIVFFILFIYFNSYNLLRQTLAEAISLIAWANMGYSPSSRKNNICNVLLFILAGSFHSIAFMNIPLYFLCKIRFSRNGLLRITIFAVIFTPVLQVALSFIMNLVAGDKYSVVGFALINAVLSGVLFAFCWYFYDDICALDSNAYMYMNLAMFIFILILNSGALFLPFRIFDMMKILYIFIIPYLLKGIRSARMRFGMECVILAIFGAWFVNAYFLQDSAFAKYQTVFIDFRNLIGLP